MTSLLNCDAEDRFEEWLSVHMFFGGSGPESRERLSHECGFRLHLSEFRRGRSGRQLWAGHVLLGHREQAR